MKTSEYKINGIRLHAFTNPNLNSFCIGVYVRAGSMFDDEKNNGISHLLEHVIYRNLKKQYDENFYELLAVHGVDIFATTYKEFVRFAVEGPSYSFDFTSDLICKIFNEINIDSNELELEKTRIKAEIRENDEKNTLDYIFNKAVWQGTNSKKTVLGSWSTVNRISLKKLNEYRNRIFSDGNVFVVVTGSADNQEINGLKNKLDNVKINPDNINFKNEVQCIGDFFNRSNNITVRQNYWHYIKIGFDVDTQKYKGGVHDLIYAILFKGDKSLFYNSLSEDNPLVYSYDSTYEQYDDVSNISLKFEVDEDNLYDAFEAVVETLNALKSGEFNFEANYRCELATWNMVLDNPSNLNWDIAYYNFILKTDKIDYSAENFGRLKDITKEQIMQAAKEIFRRKNMTVVMKGNKRKIKIEKINEILSQLDTE